MTPTVDEALEALEQLSDYADGYRHSELKSLKLQVGAVVHHKEEAAALLRQCLESLAQEQRDWRAIEEHRTKNRTRVSLALGYYRCPVIEILGRGGEPLFECEAPARALALSAAAAYCRSNP